MGTGVNIRYWRVGAATNGRGCRATVVPARSAQAEVENEARDYCKAHGAEATMPRRESHIKQRTKNPTQAVQKYKAI